MCRLLIVDDSAGFRKVLRETLGARFPSMQVMEAGSAEEAFPLLDELVPELMFIDIGLPGINGLTLTRQVRAAHADMTIVIFTNYDDPEYRRAGLACGADRFMSKVGTGRDEIVLVVQELMYARGLLGEAGFPAHAPSSG